MATDGNPLTDHLDLWTSALLTKSTAGRGGNGKLEAYGIKKLRELILELAVRGKLEPQDSKDEPATVLLKKIAKEKAQLINGGKLRKETVLSKITEDDKPFVLPLGWEWERLGNLFDIQDSKRIPINSAERASRNGPYPYYGANGQVGLIDDFIFDGERILIAEDGGFFDDPIRGVAYVVNGKFWVNNHAHVLECLGETSAKYWTAYLNRLDWKPLVRGMTREKLNQAVMIQIVIAVPPLAEQHRIVAKVDELMALCDRLEQQQAGSQEAHQTLVETLLGTLTQITVRGEPVEARPSTSSGRTEIEEAWTRIADHFDTLFTTEHSIDQLKQTILQLAVMGKLVPQDPGDEPASTLLSRIAKQKEWLVDNRIIRKQKLIPAITREEIVLNLPMGWEWCRLQDIVYVLGDGLHGTPEYTPNERFHFVNGNNLVDGEILIKPDTKTVAEDQYEKYKKPLGNNSVLVSINGTLGSVAFYNNEDIILGKSACFFNLAEDIYKSFIKVVLDAPSFTVYAEKNSTGTTIKNLGLGAMNSFAIALPPKEEQHRIVAKVDELMTLCDTLKARLKAAQTTQINLADAIVELAAA